MTQHSVRTWLINKVRSILGINEHVHYHSAQTESLRQLQQLLKDRLPAAHEQTPGAAASAIVDLSDSSARKFAALDQQVVASLQELQIMQQILNGRLQTA